MFVIFSPLALIGTTGTFDPPGGTLGFEACPVEGDG